MHARYHRSAPVIAVLDRFRMRLLADAGLQQRLAAIEDDAAFVTTTLASAAALGIPLERALLEDALRPDPLGRNRFDDAAVTARDWPCAGWLPTAVIPTNGEPAVEWLHFGGARLDAPFYDMSIRVARRRPFNRLVRWRTPLSALPDHTPLVKPGGFIFHMSRCGSTLIAQMLASIERAIVVSEAAPFDAIVQLAQSWSEHPWHERVLLLQAMIGALGRDAGASDKRYFVKLDSWHTAALPLFRTAFPDTPWVFLYRDPIEVMVSHMRMRGLQTVPGAIGDVFAFADGLSPEAQVATVLAQIVEPVFEHADDGLLIEYRTLPDAVTTRIFPHFGLMPTPDDHAAMAAAMRRDAKRPTLAFTADRACKQAAASPAIRTATKTYLATPYRHLVALERAQLSKGLHDRAQAG